MKKITLLILFVFLSVVGFGQANIIISEVTDASSFSAEYVEIYNAGNAAQDLLNWKLQQYGSTQSTTFSSTITTNMTGNYTLNPGEYVVVCRGTLTDLTTAYPSFSGYYFTTNSTSSGAPQMNGGEYYELIDASATIVDYMGSISSTTAVSKTYDRNDALSVGDNISTDWTELANSNGTPGAANVTPLANDNSSGGNVNPTITNIGTSPMFPLGSETVNVFADVTDSDGTLATVELHWGLASGSLPNTINMSVSSGDTYEIDTDIPAQGNNATVYFEIYAQDNQAGETTSSEMSYVTPATTTLPYSETFDAGLGACYVYSVSGNSKTWYWNSAGTAEINGYNSGDLENDWLILPAIDFDSYTNVIMTFDNWYNYGNDDADNYLKLMYSSDYAGTGDPSAATWTELTFSKSESWNLWVNSLLVDLTSVTGSSVYIAFEYNYNAGSYRDWQIDNISISEGTLVDVTFQVNMSDETPSVDGVHMAGSFSDWWNPAGYELTDPDLNGIYDITLSLYAGVEYQFKYINGNTWANVESVPANCQAPGSTNRFEVLANSNYAIDPVCFSSCSDCGVLINYDITFQVDMQNQVVSANGVHLAGGFSSPYPTWDPAGILMVDDNADQIYTVTLNLPENTYYEYKFVNGNTWGDAEFIPSECEATGTDNRYFTTGSANNTLPLVCFGSCEACPPPALLISEVTDPADNANARFVELYNASGSTIDFDAVDWYIVKQVNGVTQYHVPLAGSVDAGNTFVIANNITDFRAAYGFDPDQANTQISGNGDDGYYLYINGDETTGTLVDAYGVIGEDGTGKPWEYLDSKAVRLRWVDTPSATWQAWQWNIPSVANANNMTPGVHKADVAWAGTIGSDWNAKGANWSGTNGYIPDASFNVTVPPVSNLPEISAASACNNLTVESAASLTISTNKDLTLYGNLSVDAAATFTINSDATGAGSLITYGNVTGNTVVQRYMGDEEWHLVSSPVSNATADVFYDSYLQYYNETVPEWVEVTSYLDPLNVMQGYAMWGVLPIRGTYEFTGTPNTGNKSIGFTAANEYGWNLVGNPYPSGIDWDLVTIPGNMNNAVYYLDAATGNYVSYLGTIGGGSQYIPPMQGFWISANSAGTLTFDNNVRTHQGTNNYYKNEEIISNYIELQVQGGDMVDKTYIRLNDEATADFDGKYDAYKLMAANKAYPQLFTIAGSDRLSINQLPATDIIPLGFYVENSGTYTISLNELNDIQSCQLEDLKTGVLQDLQKGSYAFNYTQGETEDRFLLHLTAASVAQSGAEESVKIYAVGQEIFVKSVNPIDNGVLRITDLAGRTLAEESISNENFIRLSTNLKSGIYLVTIAEPNGLRTEKVIIN